VDDTGVGAGGANRLASGKKLPPWSRSARVGGHGDWRRSASRRGGLESRCSSGTLAVSTEDDEGSDRRSPKEGVFLAFPFPLSRYSVRGRDVVPFPLSRIDFGSVGGECASTRGGGLAVEVSSEGEVALLDVDAALASQLSSGWIPHPGAALPALTSSQGGGDKGRVRSCVPTSRAAMLALTTSRGGGDKGRVVVSSEWPEPSPNASESPMMVSGLASSSLSHTSVV
jgi:hypothetical protein